MKKTALALTACAALTLAACGGEETLSKAEFTKQANAICASMEKKMEAAGEKAATGNPGATMDDMMKDVVEAAVPVLEDTVTKLRALAAPEDLQDDFDAMLDEVASTTDKIEKDPKVLMDDATFEDANKKATDLGLDKCAS